MGSLTIIILQKSHIIAHTYYRSYRPPPAAHTMISQSVCQFLCDLTVKPVFKGYFNIHESASLHDRCPLFICYSGKISQTKKKGIEISTNESSLFFFVWDDTVLSIYGVPGSVRSDPWRQVLRYYILLFNIYMQIPGL